MVDLRGFGQGGRFALTETNGYGYEEDIEEGDEGAHFVTWIRDSVTVDTYGVGCWRCGRITYSGKPLRRARAPSRAPARIRRPFRARAIM